MLNTNCDDKQVWFSFGEELINKDLLGHKTPLLMMYIAMH